jgi:hypothetical protein
LKSRAQKAAKKVRRGAKAVAKRVKR